MDIIGLIAQNNLTGDAATVTAALNAVTVKHTNHARRTATDLLGIFGVARVIGWNTAIATAGGSVAVQALAGAGLDFAHETTIEAVQMFGQMGVFDAKSVADLLGLGTWYTSIWQDAGGEGEAQESEVAAALVTIAAQDEISRLQQRLSIAYQESNNVLAQGGTWDQAVANITRTMAQ